MIKFDVTSMDEKTFEWLHYSPTGTLTRAHYVASIKFGGAERDQFRIKLPSIKINDQIHEIPEIEFKRKKGFGIIGP